MILLVLLFFLCFFSDDILAYKAVKYKDHEEIMNLKKNKGKIREMNKISFTNLIIDTNMDESIKVGDKNKVESEYMNNRRLLFNSNDDYHEGFFIIHFGDYIISHHDSLNIENYLNSTILQYIPYNAFVIYANIDLILTLKDEFLYVNYVNYLPSIVKIADKLNN